MDQTESATQTVVGEAPLTPVQCWFFEQELEDIHHFNQAFLLEVSEPLERQALEGALGQLVQHHDTLRLRFTRESGGWKQKFSAYEGPPPLGWVDLSELDEHRKLGEIEAIAEQTQASLNFVTGPLWRVVYFEFGLGSPARLLLVFHHLVIDGISWRPLIEDLETAYEQLRSGRSVQLPTKTSSFKAWAERLRQFSQTDSLQSEIPHWRSLTGLESFLPDVASRYRACSSPVTTSRTGSLKSTLSAEETQTLLQEVPSLYNTQINDILIAALVRGWERWSGKSTLLLMLEGHGREALFEDVDLSRTVGWFTSIFPVRLDLKNSGEQWFPGETLKDIKEQMRQIPRRGIGYGILRYLCPESGLSTQSDPPLVFNYFGRLDQLLADSKLFGFAVEPAGPWRSEHQHRRYALELNAQVIHGRLEFEWTYLSGVHSEQSIQSLAREVSVALSEVIRHCQTPDAWGRTSSDFPLARLDQTQLDRLLVGRRDVEDIYPLSPIQTLFHSANPERFQTQCDQWHCTLQGPLDVSAFQRAWLQTLHRHTVLCTTIHEEGLPEPLQMVHRDVELPWRLEDWRNLSPDQQKGRWSALLSKDQAQPISLNQSPMMRFTLIHMSEDSWKFLWTVPAILLDGWSWPLVFRDVSRIYDGLSQQTRATLTPAGRYGEYIEWLHRQSPSEALDFWRATLKGFCEPTSLPRELAGQAQQEQHNRVCSISIAIQTTERLESCARILQCTLNTLVQGAWAIFLSRQTGKTDIVFGAAFSGRPTDLPGAGSIVGPFVNNLPIRVYMNTGQTVAEFLRDLHAHLLQMAEYQFTPLIDIQRCSEVPWRYRLFDSLVVFQNYLVGDAARCLGKSIAVSDFVGPIHTNYPLLLLAEPGTAPRFRLLYDSHNLKKAVVERWSQDLALLLDHLPRSLEQPVGQLQSILSPPAAQPTEIRKAVQAKPLSIVRPQNRTESIIVQVCETIFSSDRISVTENFFDLGAHSLLLVQMHNRLQQELQTDFPVVTMFAYPTVRALAAHLDRESADPVAPAAGAGLRDRAERQREALARMRQGLTRKTI